MAIRGLYANRTSHADFVRNAFSELSADRCNVYIAVAFFTEAKIVEQLLTSGCHIRLIVRLGFPTSATALSRLMGRSDVEIRYFTDRSFHPKLYIFGDRTALVGSANLTDSALNSNQEIVVSVSADDERFVDLAGLFAQYWRDASVLTETALKDYDLLYKEYSRITAPVEALNGKLLASFGTVAAKNIERGRSDAKKPSRSSVFVEDFRKTYQESVAAFEIVRALYSETGYRKVAAAVLPLRIEIDSFFSFVREQHAIGDAWKQAPRRSPSEQRAPITALIDLWRSTPWPHLEQTVAHVTYPRLQRVFASAETVQRASDEDLFAALTTLHSFHDRLRFYANGLEKLQRVFLQANDGQRLRDVLVYLVFGPGDTPTRMARSIYDDYKLNEFGPANVHELIGWCNREGLPILNGRTTKVLRYLGSDVRQLEDR